MKIVVAIDSFKGSLSTQEAAKAIREGAKRACPEAEVYTSPLADGGEGTAEALTAALGGETVSLTVRDPLGRPISATYSFVAESKTAIMEMAAAAGLPLLSPEERCPMAASTYGVGQMIADAMEKGARRFLLGVGGSATNDGGVGMLKALGFSFFDKDGALIGEGAGALRNLHTISNFDMPRNTGLRPNKTAVSDLRRTCYARLRDKPRISLYLDVMTNLDEIINLCHRSNVRTPYPRTIYRSI